MHVLHQGADIEIQCTCKRCVYIFGTGGAFIDTITYEWKGSAILAK